MWLSSIWVFMFGQLFYVSFLNTELQREYGVGSELASLIHALRPGAILIANFLVSLLPKSINRPLLIFLNFAVQAGCALLTGPSWLFGFPGRVELIATGLFLRGFSDGLCYGYFLPEVVDILTHKDTPAYTVEAIGDTAAGLQGLMVELGFMSAFFLGPLLSENIGFR